MGWADYSYTAATGKRPFFDRDAECSYSWSNEMYLPGDLGRRPHVVPDEVLTRMGGGQEGWRNHYRSYPTEAAALDAADEAFRKAVADGAMPPP